MTHTLWHWVSQRTCNIMRRSNNLPTEGSHNEPNQSTSSTKYFIREKDYIVISLSENPHCLTCKFMMWQAIEPVGDGLCPATSFAIYIFCILLRGFPILKVIYSVPVMVMEHFSRKYVFEFLIFWLKKLTMYQSTFNVLF